MVSRSGQPRGWRGYVRYAQGGLAGEQAGFERGAQEGTGQFGETLSAGGAQ